MQIPVRRALAVGATFYKRESPLYADLCNRLSQSPNHVVSDLFGRFFRILSTDTVDIRLFLGALHDRALSGASPALAAFFPSCGGAYQSEQQEALTAAVESAVTEGFDDLLDFMLSRQPVTDDPALATLTLIGAVAAQQAFGGPIALVEAGAGGGFRLLFDQYRYQIGPHQIGSGSVSFELDLEGDWPLSSLPLVQERVGIEPLSRDMTDPEELRFVLACVPPDQMDRFQRLQVAAAWMRTVGRPDLREADIVPGLAPLLTEVYNRMEPGTTLLLTQILHWSRLSSEEQKRVAFAIQSLASQIQPRKPIAWFQADRFTPGAPHLELRLHTFGWADPEDRDVLHLGTADPQLRWVRLTHGNSHESHGA